MARIILLVEDDNLLREALVDCFSYQGHVVHEAAHGAEALKLLEEGCRPGIILLDIVMPVMDGIRFMELKNADPLLSSIPVIVLSATERNPPAGTAELLAKPVDLYDLEEAITRHYGAAGAEEATMGGW